jgi:hypothetical protein
VHLSGGALVDGDFWDVPPLQIQGTRHFFSVSSKTSLTVGCQTKTADEWLACYEALFDGHGYSREARDEYKRYFNLAADLYGWDVPRFELDGAGGE